MPYTLSIVSIIVGYMWVAAPLVDAPGPWPLVAAVVVLSISIAHNRKSRDWGFSRRAFLPALFWSIGLTVPLVTALWFIGHAMGPAPIRRAPVLDFLYVMLWGGAQQFVLQTVILRESQKVAGRGAVLVAAAIFAALHLPNPVPRQRHIHRGAGVVLDLFAPSQHRTTRVVSCRGNGRNPAVFRACCDGRPENGVALFTGVMSTCKDS